MILGLHGLSGSFHIAFACTRALGSRRLGSTLVQAIEDFLLLSLCLLDRYRSDFFLCRLGNSNATVELVLAGILFLFVGAHENILTNIGSNGLANLGGGSRRAVETIKDAAVTAATRSGHLFRALR